MESLWINDFEKSVFEPLKSDLKTEVLIVGGGITGILCAYELKNAGIECAVVEADKICHGVTGNTTAKITVQHGVIYDKIISKYGDETALKYLQAQQKAAERYKELCKTIDCDYEIKDSYVYSLNKPKEIEKEIKAYGRLGYNAEFSQNLDIPIKTVGAVKIKNQAQFNPLKFCYFITSGLKIFENTKVLEFFKGGVITNKGKIYAKKTIIATHFPIINKHGGYFVKMYQHRSYVIALKDTELPNGMFVDEDISGMSFRTYNNMLLLGGGSHRTGKKGGNWQELSEFAKKNYVGSREVARWATQDCMTLDSIPYIGQYSRNTPNLFVATGFNKWGMTSSMVSALILKDLIQGKQNDYADVFSPSRSIFHSQLAKNAAETLFNLLTPTAPRCPHLGCALKYNKAERSWDCPCHGSRFTKDGKLIENPATDDKKF